MTPFKLPAVSTLPLVVVPFRRTSVLLIAIIASAAMSVSAAMVTVVMVSMVLLLGFLVAVVVVVPASASTAVPFIVDARVRRARVLVVGER